MKFFITFLGQLWYNIIKEIQNREGKMKIYKAIIFIFLFIGLFTLQANAAARLSGKILAVRNGVYTVELGDGSKVDIKLQSGAKSMRGQGIGAFRTGETAVFNVISALNDNPLLADAVMDVAYANQNSTSSYTMLRNTKIGGFATAAGPAPMGGQRPDAVGRIGTGGSKNLSPAPKVNVPFTAAPAPMGSPVIGEALTNGGNNPTPQSNMFNQQNGMNQNNMNSPLNPLNQQAPSGMFQQPNGMPNGMGMPQGNDPMMNLTMGTADPSSLILGGKKNTAEGMIYGNGVQGQNNMDPSRIFAGGNDDDDEDESDGLEALNPANINGMAGQQVNTSGKIMNVDMSKGVIFYMSANAPGMQELGSVVITPATILLDGRTGQAISAQDIKPGMNMQVNGIMQNGAIRATKLTVIP